MGLEAQSKAHIKILKKDKAKFKPKSKNLSRSFETKKQGNIPAKIKEQIKIFGRCTTKFKATSKNRSLEENEFAKLSQ